MEIVRVCVCECVCACMYKRCATVLCFSGTPAPTTTQVLRLTPAPRLYQPASVILPPRNLLACPTAAWSKAKERATVESTDCSQVRARCSLA